MKIPRKYILGFVTFIVLYLIYQRLRFVVFVSLTPLQAIIGIVVIVGILYLILDHLFNKE